MKSIKAWWSAGWRVAVCLLLLLWIFHSIFLNEGRLRRSGKDCIGSTWPGGNSGIWPGQWAAGLVADTLPDSPRRSAAFPAFGRPGVVDRAWCAGGWSWRRRGLNFPGARHAHFLCGAIFQFLPAWFNRRRFDQSLLRGAGNASQENGGGDDGFRGSLWSACGPCCSSPA